VKPTKWDRQKYHQGWEKEGRQSVEELVDGADKFIMLEMLQET